MAICFRKFKRHDFLSIILTLGGLLATACQGGYSGPVESLTVGTVRLEPSTLVFVAEVQDYFSRYGLNVSIQYYESGLNAVNAMMEGKVDVACPATEFVLVGKAFNKESVQTIAAIDKVDYAALVGRKDRGITSLSGLAGKKIGVSRGTILEFRLGRFLELNGMKTMDVEVVNMGFARSVDAISGSEVDAIVAIPPYTDAAKARLGDNGVVWPAQGGQYSYQLLIAKTEWLRRNSKLVERLIKAMSEAEDFVARKPQEAKAIVKQKLNIEDSDVARIWSQNQFGLSLDQSLVTAMEDQARWMINNNLTNEKQVPNFLDYIFEDALKAVKSGAVNIIR